MHVLEKREKAGIFKAFFAHFIARPTRVEVGFTKLLSATTCVGACPGGASSYQFRN